MVVVLPGAVGAQQAEELAAGIVRSRASRATMEPSSVVRPPCTAMAGVPGAKEGTPRAGLSCVAPDTTLRSARVSIAEDHGAGV